MDSKSFYQNYIDHNFVFSNELLTRYCLSLFTKPFVILSGISGTGKTKIAQLFDIPIILPEPSENSQNTTVSKSKEWITLRITEGIFNDGRANLPVSSLEAIYEPSEITVIKAEISRLMSLGKDKDNINEEVEINILHPETGETIQAAVYLQRPYSPLVRVRFKSKRGRKFYDSRKYLKDHFKIGDVLGLVKIGPKSFKIETINEPNTIQIAEEHNIIEQKNLDNKLFVSVRSDWTDSSPIVGYYNLITQQYCLTPIIKLFLRAKENPTIPFFLILDEMNLSKVEHYFSDILSCMESRLLSNNGSLKQEKIFLYGAEDVLETDDIEYDIIPSELEIPLNIYITGTVNIDESTYMFSPKVLDRANVIEFNEVDLNFYEKSAVYSIKDEKVNKVEENVNQPTDGLFGNESSIVTEPEQDITGAPSDTTVDATIEPAIEQSSINPPASIFTLTDFPPFGYVELASRGHYLTAPKEAKFVLQSLLNILTPFNLHFGYRIVNEFSHFILNSIKYVGSDKEIITKAIDIQIVQKILPKLNGSFNRLDEPIRNLIAFLSLKSASGKDVNLEFVNSLDLKTEKYPLSLKKLSSMYTALVNVGFASFIE